MKPFALWLSAVAVLATAAGASRADYTLSLSAENADVNNLHVGDTVTFDVTLSGINTSDSTTYLSYLAATVSYNSNSTLLSAPLAVTAGSIIPDATDFYTDNPLLLIEADGVYDSVNGPDSNALPISTNGTFFSFEVMAVSPGEGTLSFLIPGTQFSNVAATPANGNQNFQITPTPAELDFTIYATGANTAVPEPSTFVLLISSLFGLSAGAGLRGLVRRVHLVK